MGIGNNSIIYYENGQTCVALEAATMSSESEISDTNEEIEGDPDEYNLTEGD